MADSLDFTLPNQIRDFVFDLHELTRITFRSDDLQQVYELKFKELTEKFFPQSQWPDARAVSPECNSDEKFLIFYRYTVQRYLLCNVFFYVLSDEGYFCIRERQNDIKQTQSVVLRIILNRNY